MVMALCSAKTMGRTCACTLSNPVQCIISDASPSHVITFPPQSSPHETLSLTHETLSRGASAKRRAKHPHPQNVRARAIPAHLHKQASDRPSTPRNIISGQQSRHPFTRTSRTRRERPLSQRLTFVASEAPLHQCRADPRSREVRG